MLYLDNDDDWLHDIEDMFGGSSAPSASNVETSTPVLKNQKRKSDLKENVDPVENGCAVESNCGEEVNGNNAGESSKSTAASTPIFQIGSRKRKNELITPAEKKIKIAAPSTPRKAAAPPKVTVPDLNIYRKGNEKPPHSYATLAEYYFIEKNLAVGTSKDICDWILQFGWFKEQGKLSVQRALSHALRRRDNTFASEGSKNGVWRYLQSDAEEEVIPEKEEENRAWSKEEGERKYQIEWEKDNVSFWLEGYRFGVKTPNGNKYAVCTECRDLREVLSDRDWKIGDNQLEPISVCTLDFIGEKVVQGCPWAVRNVPHLCLQRKKIVNEMRIADLKKRISSAEARIKDLIETIEEKLEASAENKKIDKAGDQLKKFLDAHSLVHPYTEGEKLCFLYFMVKDGVLKYVGLSTDFEQRSEKHPRGDYSTLFEDEIDVEFIVVPLGKRNELFIMDLEAMLIQLCKAHVLGDNIEIVNLDGGRFSSKFNVLAAIVEKPKHKNRKSIIDAAKELLHLGIEFGEHVILEGKSDAQKSSETKYYLNRNNIKLQRLQQQQSPPTAAKEPSTAASSQSSQLGSSHSFIFSSSKVFQELYEEIAVIHPYNNDQVPYSLYFLLDPVSNDVLRYGISNDVSRREEEHGIKFGQKFNFVVASLGVQNMLFMKDLEAMLIRMSKQKVLKDGKKNMNKDRDIGLFASKYHIFEAIVEEEHHHRRPFLIQALNELIKKTRNSEK